MAKKKAARRVFGGDQIQGVVTWLGCSQGPGDTDVSLLLHPWTDNSGNLQAKKLRVDVAMQSVPSAEQARRTWEGVCLTLSIQKASPAGKYTMEFALADSAEQTEPGPKLASATRGITVKGDKLRLPPFPALVWDGYSWVGTKTFKAWKRPGEKLNRSQINIRVPDDPPEPPSPAQIKAYAYFEENQDKIASSVLRALLKWYPGERERWVDVLEEDEFAELMPPVQTEREVLQLLLESEPAVHVFSADLSGVAYLGLGFSCTWEQEHGLGVLLHRSRVAEIGQADVSFVEWIAERDRDSRTEKKAKTKK